MKLTSSFTLLAIGLQALLLSTTSVAARDVDYGAHARREERIKAYIREAVTDILAERDEPSVDLEGMFSRTKSDTDPCYMTRKKADTACDSTSCHAADGYCDLQGGKCVAVGFGTIQGCKSCKCAKGKA